MGCKKLLVPSPSGTAELDSCRSSFSDLRPVKQEKGDPCLGVFLANALSGGSATSRQKSSD